MKDFKAENFELFYTFSNDNWHLIASPDHKAIMADLNGEMQKIINKHNSLAQKMESMNKKEFNASMIILDELFDHAKAKMIMINELIKLSSKAKAA